MFRNIPEPLSGLLPITIGERCLSQAQLQLRKEFLDGQIAFETVTFGTARIRDNYGRSPLRAEALETLRVLFDMDLQRNEVLIDEAGNPFIGINLGIQPSACASRRRRAEIEEQGLVLKLRFRERSVNILLPSYGHPEFPPLMKFSASSMKRTTRN